MLFSVPGLALRAGRPACSSLSGHEAGCFLPCLLRPLPVGSQFPAHLPHFVSERANPGSSLSAHGFGLLTKGVHFLPEGCQPSPPLLVALENLCGEVLHLLGKTGHLVLLSFGLVKALKAGLLFKAGRFGGRVLPERQVSRQRIPIPQRVERPLTQGPRQWRSVRWPRRTSDRFPLRR